MVDYIFEYFQSEFVDSTVDNTHDTYTHTTPIHTQHLYHLYTPIHTYTHLYAPK